MLKRVFVLMSFLCLVLASSAMAETKDVTIDGDHGKLAAIIQTPDGKDSYPVVIICHGFTSRKEFSVLKNLADDLEADGIASVRFDFNGHGASEGRFQDMTVLNEISDAKKVYEYVKNNFPNATSISLAGHSQGGVVASMTAGELGDNITALVLLAPAAVLRDDSIRGSLFDTKFNSLNPPEYVAIMGGNYKVGRNYILTARDLPIYETARKFRGAACMIHGTGDIIVPYTYSLRYHEIFSNSELNIIEEWDHGFRGHEAEAARLAANFFKKVLLK